jgi:hypothetical protein
MEAGAKAATAIVIMSGNAYQFIIIVTVKDDSKGDNNSEHFSLIDL